MTTTTWPGTVDGPQTRTDGVDTVEADDHNYQDGQIRAIESWLGDGVEDLIGDDGTSSHGPGGLASPVASGGVAITLAAKDNYTSGKLLSVGDNLDGTYAEQVAITYNGIIEAQGVELSSTVTVTSILDEDAMTSNSATALATQQSIKAYSDAGGLKNPGCYNRKQTVTSSSNAVAVNCASGLNVRHVLTENTEIGVPTNAADGMVLRFFIKQMSGSSYTVAWESVFYLSDSWVDPSGSGAQEIAAIAFFFDAAEGVWLELCRSYVNMLIA